jgi:hypothetical protein
VIEAVQLPPAGEDISEAALADLHHILRDAEWESSEYETLVIHTLEGSMTASPSDWVIRGVQGECYPCKPDIFAMTYEPMIKESN